MDSILNTEQVREMVDTLWVSWHYRRRLVTLADSHEQMRADRDALAEALRTGCPGCEKGLPFYPPPREKYHRGGTEERPVLVACMLPDVHRSALAVHGSGEESGA